MVLCPECGQDVKEAKFCANCGATLPEVVETNTVNQNRFCPNCGTSVDANFAVCPQCGFQLAQAQQPQTKFCPSCGQSINFNAEICPHCGVRVAPVPTEQKSVAVAVILSLVFPGLGQFYLGLNTKGISFVVGYIISIVLMFVLIGFILIFVVVIWALIDAIKSAEAINKGEYVEDKLF